MKILSTYSQPGFDFTVVKLDSGKFQLTMLTPASERVLRFRAKSIEELAPLSASSTFPEYMHLVRDVVYDADDAEFASREEIPAPAPLRPYTS